MREWQPTQAHTQTHTDAHTDTDAHTHTHVHVQVETEGALAREVYDALQSTEQLGTDLICFLDQYDLSQGLC